LEPKKQKKQIQIELDEKTSQGEYVNLVIVTHSPAEFILDFTRVLPGLPKAKVKSRVIMAPTHAKSLMMVLQENLRKYENKFGEIKIHKQEPHPGFGIKVPEDILPN